MSENAPRNHEAHKPNHEKIEVSKSHEIHHKNQESEAALSPEKARENLETIRHEVAKKATSKEDITIGTPENEKIDSSQPLIDKELKGVMLSRTISRIQKQLKPVERTFSKVIHNKPIDKISSVSEKTIARPYGFLGGAIFAFIGSVFSTFISKQFGLSYNLILFLMLFILGYIVTSFFEGLVRLFQRAK